MGRHLKHGFIRQVSCQFRWVLSCAPPHHSWFDDMRPTSKR